MKRILIIDDDATWVDMLSIYLHRADAEYEVLLAMDGTSGLAEIRLSKPDLVLCDLCMPHGNGYDVVATCRRSVCTRELLIVACTGSGVMDTDTMARAVGFDGIIHKDWGEEKIQKAVAGFLSRG